jgi:hypothetical protein
MSDFCQLDLRWKDILMGNGTSSIGAVGCYMCSLVSGLSDRGYGWDPASFNLLLIADKAWVGPYENYIDSGNLEKYMPDVFTSFKKINPYNDQPKIDQLVGENLIGVCRVNARAIGGTGTHYLLLKGQNKGVALIFDPYTNKIEPITTTYGNYGDILGIDVFGVKVKSTVPTSVPTQPLITNPISTPVVTPPIDPVVPSPIDPLSTPVTAPVTPTAPITPEPVDTTQPSIPSVWVNGSSTIVISKPNIFQRIMAFLKWLVS